VSTPLNVSIVVGKYQLANWISYEIDGNILTPSDAFTMRVGLPDPDHLEVVTAGAHCSIYVNQKLGMKGVIDEVELEYSKSNSSNALAITGRDLAAYLVDCSAPLDGYDQITLKELARKICSPWSIPVRAAAEANREIEVEESDAFGFGTLPRTQPEPGETCWEFLARYAKDQGLFMWMSPDGALIISKPNDTQKPLYSLRHFLRERENQRNNVLRGRIVRATAERYSHVTVKAQTQGDDYSFGEEAAQIEATATDEELTARGIYRPLILADYDISTIEQAQRRAVQEVRLRRAKGLKAVYTVPGHGDGSNIYQYDQTVEVHDELADLNGIFYILGRRLKRDRTGGTRTVLTLAEKGTLTA